MRLSLAIGLTLGAALAGLPTARAADAPPALAEAGKLEDIVVTAERREESAQSVGISLSVLTATALADAGVEKVNDLANLTPSLEVEPAFSSGQPQFRLRGVGFIDYTSNNASPVGVTVDEVPAAFPIQTQGQIFDVSRVEVLRGPQGTLYGLNTTGGAVNFISNRPTAATASGLSVDYGSHEALAATGFISATLTEGLRGRLAISTEQGGAWQRNRDTGEALGAKHRLAARAQLEWLPSDTTDVRLTLLSATDKSDAYGTQLLVPFTPTGSGAVIPADTSPYATGWSLLPSFARQVGISPGSKPGVDNLNNAAILNVNVEVGGLKLTSITAYDKFLRRELGDWDSTSYAESDIYFHDDISTFSEEVRLASVGDGPLGWVAGAYYAHNKLAEYFYGDFTHRLGASALTRYRQVDESIGVFAQGRYQFTDRLKATLGLRPEHERRDLLGLNTSFGPFPSLNGGPQDRSLTNSDLSGKAQLDFQLAPRALLYGSVSRGVKSGGFTAHNTVSANPAILDGFAPEKLLAYELGVKVDVAAALRINASVFDYDYRDQQILSKYHDPVTGTDIGRFINAPKSRITGGEVELEWAPGNGFEVSQYVGYKQGKYTAPVLNSNLVDFNGKDLDFPKLSYGGQLSFEWGLAGYRLKAETNYSYHDKYDQPFLLETVDANANVVGAPQFEIESYWLGNASLALSPAGAKSWSVSIWGHNITNQRYFLTKNYFLPNTNIGAAGEPTTVGIHVDWSY